MTYKMRIMKRNPLGNMEIREIFLAGLEEILTPQDIFMMEFELNKIPYLRVHIEETNEKTKNQETKEK